MIFKMDGNKSAKFTNWYPNTPMKIHVPPDGYKYDKVGDDDTVLGHLTAITPVNGVNYIKTTGQRSYMRLDGTINNIRPSER